MPISTVLKKLELENADREAALEERSIRAVEQLEAERQQIEQEHRDLPELENKVLKLLEPIFQEFIDLSKAKQPTVFPFSQPSKVHRGREGFDVITPGESYVQVVFAYDPVVETGRGLGSDGHWEYGNSRTFTTQYWSETYRSFAIQVSADGKVYFIGHKKEVSIKNGHDFRSEVGNETFLLTDNWQDLSWLPKLENILAQLIVHGGPLREYVTDREIGSDEPLQPLAPIEEYRYPVVLESLPAAKSGSPFFVDLRNR